MADTQDLTIINSVLNGDTEAFETLILRHQKMVFSIVAKHVPSQDVAEVAQEVFAQVFKSLKSFRGDAPFLHWIGSIATRTSAAYWRKQGRQSRVVPVSSLSTTANDFLDCLASGLAIEKFENEKSQAGISEIIDRVLEGVGPDERVLIQLLYFDDKSVREVASLLGISMANVKIKSFRLRAKLKSQIEILLEEKVNES